MVEQGVDQSAVEIARRGMDDHPGRLVDDEQMLVLEDDVERDVLRLVMRGLRLGDGDLDRLPATRLHRGIAHQRALRPEHRARSRSAPSAARATGSARRPPAPGRAASRRRPPAIVAMMMECPPTLDVKMGRYRRISRGARPPCHCRFPGELRLIARMTGDSTDVRSLSFSSCRAWLNRAMDSARSCAAVAPA